MLFTRTIWKNKFLFYCSFSLLKVHISAYLKFINLLPVWVWSCVTSQRGEHRESNQSVYVVTAMDCAASSHFSDASSLLLFIIFLPSDQVKQRCPNMAIYTEEVWLSSNTFDWMMQLVSAHKRMAQVNQDQNRLSYS